jgi:hypothetical protein
MKTTRQSIQSRKCLFGLICLAVAVTYCGCQTQPKREGSLAWVAPGTTLTLFKPEVDALTGKMTVNGIDTRRPGIPFTWNWGDGHTDTGWFPQSHIYTNSKREQTLTVTAHYEGGETSAAQLRIPIPKR